MARTIKMTVIDIMVQDEVKECFLCFARRHPDRELSRDVRNPSASYTATIKERPGSHIAMKMYFR
jgi:hypothetical protein